MFNVFFGFEGRIGRTFWWFGHILSIVLVLVALQLLNTAKTFHDDPGRAILYTLVSLCFSITCIWISFAVNIKRYRDIGYSGWMSALSLIPLIGLIVVGQCGFMRGSDGNNEYGPPPGTGIADDLDALGAPGSFATRELDFSKYRSQPTSDPQIRPTAILTSSSSKPAFGKRV